jgi:TRAP-type C4-dicarboxylate transport system permease small subunit
MIQRAAAQLLGYAVALTLFAMMALTCADVAGRYLLNRPIQGAFELTEMLLAAMIFTALPLVTLRGEHVTVDLFDAVTPDRILRVQHVLACAIGAVCTGFLAYRLGVRAENMVASGQTTAQLQFTLGWLTWGMTLMMALTSAALAVLALRPPQRHSVEDRAL